ncbi:MAG: adenylate/guanylate cyclase domain-containing protein [Pseudomonadota bacterium]
MSPKDGEYQQLLSEAERRAERLIALMRMGISITLAIVFSIIINDAAPSNELIVNQLNLARASIGGFGLLGIVAFVLTSERRYRPWFGFVFATADVVFVSASLAASIKNYDVSGLYLPAMPTLWVVPMVLAANALRFSWRVQAYAGVLLVVSLSIVGRSGPPREAGVPQTFGSLFSFEPNVMRLTMVALASIVLVVAVVRTRRLLRTGLDLARRRALLTHYMPPQVAALIEKRAVGELRSGRRQEVAILFVDIRGFGARSEKLAPEAVSSFLGTFRQILRKAADTHNGVIDKFIGDGAMIVFGIPNPGPKDAADAVGCASAILEGIADWSRQLVESGAPPVAVGIGLHMGEAFVGAIGDDERLEFSVVGDVVNVAARMEEATKTVGCPVVATAEIVMAAGVSRRSWRALPDLVVRGKNAPVAAFARRDLQLKAS